MSKGPFCIHQLDKNIVAVKNISPEQKAFYIDCWV